VGAWWDRWSLDVGADPDPRFSYANERTFLAWCRTALALMTAGLAITQLLPPFDLPAGRRIVGLPLIATGIVLAAGALVQWLRTERAMRLGQPLPRSLLVPAVAGVVAVTATAALVLVVADSL
jgi:putative membrane protein